MKHLPKPVLGTVLLCTGPGGQGEVEVRLKALKFSDHMLDLLTSDGLAVPEVVGVPHKLVYDPQNLQMLCFYVQFVHPCISSSF